MIIRLHHYILLLFCIVSTTVSSQYKFCDYETTPKLSKRLANYTIQLSLDHTTKKAIGTQKIEWINNSPDTVHHVEMYMYLNAFKNNESSYISGSAMNVMGQDLSGRTKETWGYLDISSLKQTGVNDELERYYIQDIDDNINDQSVLKVELKNSVLPGDTLYLDTSFESKLPKTIARVGYSTNDFHFFVHWYPKLGVFEKSESGQWHWNCHQFVQQTEFYGEFGVYDVEITASEHLKVGGSGCRIDQKDNGDGTHTHHFLAQDVIDFAWCAYPDFVIYQDNWKGIDIELFSPPQHKSLVPRIIGAVKNSLEYLEEHVGVYPYPKITIMDPPALGMRSGFMEYPTFITGGSFYSFPRGIKSMESLIVHEFTHQYFMAMLASNEKESPWMDEGFVTFFEDCIMEHYYGKDNSLIDILGYKMNNSAQSRNEYTGLLNKRISHITNIGWEIAGSYKGIVYAKTATVLKTLRRQLGDDLFFEIIRAYFDQYKFTHPRKEDLLKVIYDQVQNKVGEVAKGQVEQFLNQALDGTQVCDFAVSGIRNAKLASETGLFDRGAQKEYLMVKPTGRYFSSVRIEQLHDFIIPVDIIFTFKDGSTIENIWDGKGGSKLFEFEQIYPLQSVEIDPDQKVFIDIDFNNNSFTTEPQKVGLLKYASRSMFWLQNVLQTVSFLM